MSTHDPIHNVFFRGSPALPAGEAGDSLSKRGDHVSHSCCPSSQQWYQKKTWWVVVFSLAAGSVSGFWSASRPFAHAFWDYLGVIGWAILLGLFLGGILDRFVPKEYISHILARPHKRTVLYAAGLGFLASTCSHGVLALSMEIHKKGASGPAVVSFLLASPWANLPVTLLLISLFGWRGGVIILSAFFVALLTGFIFQWLDRKGWIEKNKNTLALNASFNLAEDLKSRLKNYRFTFSGFAVDLKAVGQATIELSEMVLGWIILGVVLASLAQAYLPSQLFHHYLGPTLPGLFITLIFATILEVCSEGTAPLAFEIYRQTRALGNSFVFLSAGVITDITEVGMVAANLGRRTAFWMVAVGVPQILILGYLFNRFF